MSSKMDPTLVATILETFKAPIVGRGVWFVNHCLSSAVIEHTDVDEISTEEFLEVSHDAFITYCEFIYCGHCREHAEEYIARHPFTSFNPLDYFDWLYEFHKSANEHAQKSSPSLEDVRNYFLRRGPSSIQSSNYSYEFIQAGFWHYFFLLSTKSKSRAQISYVYYILLKFIEYLPPKQRTLIANYVREFQFRKALYDNSMRTELVCISFFDWLYGAYELLNKDVGLTVFAIEPLSFVYLNLGVCDKDCDK
jgi:hypothetical protein